MEGIPSHVAEKHKRLYTANSANWLQVKMAKARKLLRKQGFRNRAGMHYLITSKSLSRIMG